jgi:hypothetical protein
MKLQRAPAVTRLEKPATVDTRLHGHRLVVARVVWGVVVAQSVLLFVFSVPGYIAQLQTLCTGASCSSEQLSAAALTSLEHLGLSLGEYVAFNVALILIGAKCATLTWSAK